MAGECAVQNLKNSIRAQTTRHGSTLSLLFLYGSWNKKAELHTYDFISTFKNAILMNGSLMRGDEFMIKESQLQFIPFQVDLNDATLDFSISDQVEHGGTLMERGHPNSSNITSCNRCLILEAPDELPALMLVYHCKNHIGNESIQTSRVVMDPQDIVDIVNGKKCKKTPLNAKYGDALKESIALALGDIDIIDDRATGIKRKESHSSSSYCDKNQVRIFVAGDRTQVGKSSVCLGILGTLIQKMNYPPSSLAYIKPATQCEETQLVTTFCIKHGIDACPVGPIVYYRGFTRAYLNGETQPARELLDKVECAVNNISRGKEIVIIDGVGYPSVGSITNTDNASVAIAAGYKKYQQEGQRERVPPGVLIVGKRGVGDAVDSYNLNANYFRLRNIPIIGAIFNRLGPDGYYSYENCKGAVTSYFRQQFDRRSTDSQSAVIGEEKVFGFIPEVKDIADTRGKVDEIKKQDDKEKNGDAELALNCAETFIEIFSRHVDVQGILRRAALLRDTFDEDNNRLRKRVRIDFSSNISDTPAVPGYEIDSNQSKMNISQSSMRLTRMQIEEAAKVQGAAGG